MNIARLLELLARITDLTAEESTELADLVASFSGDDDGRFLDLTDEQVESVVTATRDAARAVAESDSPDVDLLASIVEVHEAVDAEANTRAEEAEVAAARVADLVARVAGNDNDEEEAGTGGEAEAAASPDADETGTGDADAAADSAEVAAAAVTASAPRRRRAPLGALARNNPDAAAVAGDEPEPRTISVGRDLRGMAPNGANEFASIDELAAATAELVGRMRGSDSSGRIHLARFATAYPADRVLSPTDARHNETIVERVHESALAARRSGATDDRYEALVAAGGLCAPLPVRYDQDVLGTTTRPVAGALAGFDGSRGGVRYVPSPVLSDIGVGGGPGDTDKMIGIWTDTNDQAADPTNSATWKSIQTIECGEETTATLYLVTARARVGNLLALTWPERVQAILRLGSVAFARSAEQALLSRMKALSTNVTGNGVILGTARDVIAELAYAAWSLRTHNRVDDTYPVRVFAPTALRTSVLTDLVRQLPGDATMGQALAMFGRMLAEINVAVTWTPDLQVPAVESGSLGQIATTIEYAVHLDGTFTFIDGVNLDLGFESNTPIRDTATNAVNDYELFMEAGEQLVKFGGHQALWVTAEFCPSGSTAATTDVICGAS